MLQKRDCFVKTLNTSLNEIAQTFRNFKDSADKFAKSSQPTNLQGSCAHCGRNNHITTNCFYNQQNNRQLRQNNQRSRGGRRAFGGYQGRPGFQHWSRQNYNYGLQQQRNNGPTTQSYNQQPVHFYQPQLNTAKTELARRWKTKKLKNFKNLKIFVRRIFYKATQIEEKLV